MLTFRYKYIFNNIQYQSSENVENKIKVHGKHFSDVLFICTFYARLRHSWLVQGMIKTDVNSPVSCITKNRLQFLFWPLNSDRHQTRQISFEKLRLFLYILLKLFRPEFYIQPIVKRLTCQILTLILAREPNVCPPLLYAVQIGFKNKHFFKEKKQLQ